MDIKDYKAGDEKEILSLFELVFKTSMSLNYWLWRFQNNPAGKHFIKLMWNNDQLVGHYAVSPVKMIIDGESCLTALSMTTMTHPEYGGKGIFKDLAVALFDQLENEKQVVNIWGFPNTNSHYGFIKNLGWKDVAVVHTMAMPAKKMNAKFSSAVKLLPDFNQSHADILMQSSTTSRVKVERNLEYLKWRYLQHPSVRYEVFEIQTEKSTEFIVTKLYKSPKIADTWEVFIMEFGITDMSCLTELFEHIMAHYQGPVSFFNIWISLWDSRNIQLEKLGFAPLGNQTFLGARFNESTHSVVGDYRNWHFSFGDSDVY